MGAPKTVRLSDVQPQARPYPSNPRPQEGALLTEWQALTGERLRAYDRLGVQWRCWEPRRGEIEIYEVYGPIRFKGGNLETLTEFFNFLAVYRT